MNILFIAHRIPYPPDKGDKIRSFNEIKFLSQEHDLYLAFPVDNEKDKVYIDELKKYCKALDYEIISPHRQKITSLPCLFTRKPLSVPYFYSKKLQNVINKRLAEIAFDVILVFSSSMAEYVFKSKVGSLLQFKNNPQESGGYNKQNDINRPKLIMDFVDVDSDKWRMYAGFTPLPFSLIYRREWKRLMSYEQRIGHIFDWSIFVSEKEVELFKSFCPEACAVSIPNGVDFDFYEEVRCVRDAQDVQIKQAKRPNNSNIPNILFMGAMDYFPNEDAVLYFVSDIWPHVKKELPDARFFIVGRNPSKKVKALSEKDPNIIVTGYVPDVRLYLMMSDIFIAPLRIAFGIQNKVLDAMAAGVPVVARPEAVQGLSGYNGCICIEENSERFALSILKIIKVPHKRHKMVNDSKRFVLENHNWEENLKNLEKIINEELLIKRSCLKINTKDFQVEGNKRCY